MGMYDDIIKETEKLLAKKELQLKNGELTPIEKNWTEKLIDLDNEMLALLYEGNTGDTEINLEAISSVEIKCELLEYKLRRE